MISTFWYRWLQVAIIGVALFGATMFLAPGLTRALFGLILYADAATIDNEFGTGAQAYITLFHGITGAVILGWATAMWLVLRGPFRDGQPSGWTLLFVPLMVWYVPDTILSLYSGFWQNAVLNTVMAGMLLIPLMATRKHFARR